MDNDIDNIYGKKDTQVERIDWYSLRNTRILAFEQECQIDWQPRWIDRIDWYSLRNTRRLASK